MSEETVYEFVNDVVGERLDTTLCAHLPQLTRTQLQALIKTKRVTVDEAHMKAGERLRGGERVRVLVPPEPSRMLAAEDIPLNVVYEDAHLVVLNKPAGLVVHPAAGTPSGTLVNALLARYPELHDMLDLDDDSEDELRVGIVHRLDKDTSGLMVVARTHDAQQALATQFEERTVDKGYLALLERVPKTLKGVIDAPIGRDPRQRKRMSVQANGKPAKTAFEVLDVDFRGGQALVKLTLFTGRTHQIRVHMAFIGCPIVGDSVYGYRKGRTPLKRQFLHAAHLAFTHPFTGERLTFDAPLPEDLAEALQQLR